MGNKKEYRKLTMIFCFITKLMYKMATRYIWEVYKKKVPSKIIKCLFYQRYECYIESEGENIPIDYSFFINPENKALKSVKKFKTNTICQEYLTIIFKSPKFNNEFSQCLQQVKDFIEKTLMSGFIEKTLSTDSIRLKKLQRIKLNQFCRMIEVVKNTIEENKNKPLLPAYRRTIRQENMSFLDDRG